jgi:hypothetical protein
VTVVVVVIAEAIRWPVALVMVWVGGATLAAAERCGPGSERVALALIDVGEACSRIARQMLPPRG